MNEGPFRGTRDVALTVIARNESRCIERCLNSARAWVDRMLVLDTGSTDHTVALALACGAEVHHLPWPNDFAAARNHLLALTSATWHLVLDADEWLDAPAPNDDWRRFTHDPSRVGLLRVRSSFDLGTRVEYSDTWLPRLLPGAVRYRGAIHEQPVHPWPEVQLDITVHHDGYREQLARQKTQRNRDLLRQELAAQPDNPYLHFQLGVLHDGLQDWEQACRAHEQAITLGAWSQPYAHDLSTRLLHALTRLGRHEQALQWASTLESRWPDSSDVFFVIGQLCLDLAQREPERALDTWLPSAESAWKRCLSIGEAPALTGHVLGRGSHLAAHNLAVLYDGLGLGQQAQQIRALYPSSASSPSSPA